MFPKKACSRLDFLISSKVIDLKQSSKLDFESRFELECIEFIDEVFVLAV